MSFKVVYCEGVNEYLETLEKKSVTDKKARALLKNIRYHIELLKIKGTFFIALAELLSHNEKMFAPPVGVNFRDNYRPRKVH